MICDIISENTALCLYFTELDLDVDLWKTFYCISVSTAHDLMFFKNKHCKTFSNKPFSCIFLTESCQVDFKDPNILHEFTLTVTPG